MKLRIAIWAVVGAFVIVLLNLLAVSNLSTVGLTLAYVTCPLVALAMKHAISFNEAILINAATYALIGIAVEIVRRHYKQIRLVSN
jgi:hypothetical protein